MGSDSEGTAGASPARCVLLHRPDIEAPEPLLSALGRRSIDVSACTSAHRAMAMLCALAAGDDEAPLILLLVEGERVNLASALVDAAEMYVPVATVWGYEDHGSPQLKAVDRDDLDRWARAASRRPEPSQRSPESRAGGSRDAAGPSLKLVDEPEGPMGGDAGGSPTLDRPRPEGGVGGGVGGVSAGSGGVPAAVSAVPGDGLPDPDSGRDVSHGSAAGPMDSPVALTDDELSMLLAEDWTDPDRG